MKEVLKCYTEDPFDYKPVEEIITRFQGQKGTMIPILQAIQDAYGYLPRQALEYMAAKLKIPFSRIFGVATFYAQFHLKPRGANIIRVCQGTACHVRGAAKIMKKLQEELNLEVGGTTEDMKFTLESVACIGACGLAPVIMINDDTFGRLTPDSISDILKQF
ncbi:NADH-quinone oxidoreductase subunit NuoE [Dethiobacter alkaliphilus]|uniref:NADH-quinone oxidoreductase subunit NuoE n=1 Tax=Dethiobacter alkaliphilus TaxID=427926 RepID=UPI002225EA79|nr:NADH-quinone oxidoreductase subunit NuoE [Dethiobacter alkaliphilus]MCW3490091.1 NADH-quinone oxidoreductase subunit NuoE [Dethiobacter alkaliphilus]